MFDGAMQVSRRSEELAGFCGKRVTRTHVVKGCNEEDQEEGQQCDRQYELFVPKAACGKEDVGILPLVFAVHCQFCHVTDMVHWQTVAQKYNFVLVIPYGTENTFNANQCCGKAKDLQVDDIGFFKSVINELSTDFGTIVSKEVVYGYGHKNGGMMVVAAANLFRAISPVAGFQADLPKLNRQVGLFLHHGANDNDARITGCCTDRKFQQCSFETTNDHCTPIHDVLEHFGKANHCKGDMHEIMSDQSGLKCYEAGLDCKTNTTMCIFPKEGDFKPLAQRFPMTMDVADFFARDSCEINHGAWDYQRTLCICKDTESTEAFCITKGSLGWNFNIDLSFDDVSPMFFIVPLAAAALGILIFGIARCWKKNKAEDKYKEFFQVSTVELSDMSEEEVKPLSGFI